MREANSHIVDLLFKYFTEELNAKEVGQLDEWLNGKAQHRISLDNFNNLDWFAREWRRFQSYDEKAHWKKMVTMFPELAKRTRVQRLYRMARVAAVWLLPLVGLAALVFLLWPKGKKETATRADFPVPALTRPMTTLSLASGLVIDLEKVLPTKLIADQGSSEIYRQDKGLIYVDKGCPPDAGVGEPSGEINTLSTSKGAWCMLTLSDGSEIKVSPGSSLQYPASFCKRLRYVDLQGEAIFEVAKSRAAQQTSDSFVVHVNSPSNSRTPHAISDIMTIVARGTRFKVKAYDNDSSIHATLLEGVIMVRKNNDSLIRDLRPGEEYILFRNGADTICRVTNLKAAASWKDGEFEFEDQPLQDILGDLSRWYNVTIVYQDEQKFDGRFDLYGLRSEPVIDLLKRLEATNHVHFTIKENTVVVSH